MTQMDERGNVAVSELAAAVATAADMLNEEQHRYVERYSPCPNGCTYETVTEAITHDGRTVRIPPQLVKVAGTPECDLCEDGTVEDEDAEHLDPLIANLRTAAAMLSGAGQIV